MAAEDGHGRVVTGLLQLFVAAMLSLGPPAVAATPDRPPLALDDSSTASAFSRPLPADRQPILPAYPADAGGRAAGVLASGSFPVARIELRGNTVHDPAAIDAVLDGYADRELSFVDMVALRDELTALYVDDGYLTSGVVLESLEDGVLELTAVEGRLAEIQVGGDGRFRPQYVSGYLNGFGDPTPVNVFELEERLQLFQQQPHVQLVEAALLPGERRGESVLRIDPVESDRWAYGLEASNQLSPAIGSAQAVTSLRALNLSGRADDLLLSARGAEGLLEFMAEYDFPVGTTGRRGAIYAFGADSDIVRAPFDDLDINADSFTAGLRFRQPLHRSLQQQTHLVTTLEWRRSRTYLLGQGFSFLEGPEEGEAKMAIVRGGVESLRRTAADVIYGRLEVSTGLNALGATVNADAGVPDGRFVKLRAQFQWARRLPWLSSQGLLRVDGQLASDPLFGLERYPIGGRWTVRGYRENTLIRDNAIVGSAEWRLPLQRTSAGRSQLELRPFVDWSWSENVTGGEVGPQTLASAGVGLYWSPLEALQLEVYWGEALKDVEYAGDYDLQDDGIHFRFNWNAGK